MKRLKNLWWAVAALVLISSAVVQVAVQADDEPPAGPKIGSLPVGKVLFLGNSITLHGPAPDIGWKGNWGMAASEKHLDYVHLLVADIAKTAGAPPRIMVRNIAAFERGPETFDLA